MPTIELKEPGKCKAGDTYYAAGGREYLLFFPHVDSCAAVAICTPKHIYGCHIPMMWGTPSEPQNAAGCAKKMYALIAAAMAGNNDSKAATAVIYCAPSNHWVIGPLGEFIPLHQEETKILTMYKPVAGGVDLSVSHPGNVMVNRTNHRGNPKSLAAAVWRLDANDITDTYEFTGYG